MKITQTHVIKPDSDDGFKPDAVKIEILDMTVLVNLHSGVTTFEGSEHVVAKEGDNNTMEIHACPSMPTSLDEMLGSDEFSKFIIGLGLKPINLDDIGGLGSFLRTGPLSEFNIPR